MDITQHPQTYPKAALVTGAARRIGRAIALDLAAQGYAVALHYHRSQAEAETLAREIRRAGGKAATLQADLAQEAETSRLVPQAIAALGPLGVLVNNASPFAMDRWYDADRASWDQHIEPGLRAPFVLCQNFARALPENVGGVIVNLLDQRVWNLTPFFISYTVAKSGLWTLTRSLALSLAPRIRVNAIGPGPALPAARQSPEQFEAQVAATPLGLGTSPEEICLALRFILAARSMTGQMIALDGGQHLGWAQGKKP